MEDIKSEELVRKLEQRVEAHLELAIKELQNLNEKSLLASERGGGWSVAQCLWHLNSYGDYYLPEIEKRIMEVKKSGGKDKRFRSTWLGSYFTKMMEPTTGAKKIKAFKKHIPTLDLDAYAVVSEFIRQQEKLLELLSASEKVDLNKVKVPISISKWIKLKLGDVFGFVIAHDERHIQQIQRVLRKQNNKSVLQK